MQPSANMQPKTLVRVKRWFSHPRYDFIAVWRQGGKRQLRYFKREKDAKAFAAEKHVELLNEGRKHGGITDEERRAVLAAREAGFTVAAAVAYYARHNEALGRSMTVDAALEEFLAIRDAEGKSEVHVADLRSRLARFARSGYGARLVASVTTRDVDSFLTALVCAPQTRLNHRAVLRNFFAFAVARGFADGNPVAAAVKVKVPPKPPGILSVPDLRALLAACDPEILPAAAIAAFAGLRTAEVGRLDWANIHLERKFIELSATKNKTASRRLVTVSENLAAWLAPFRRANGPVCPGESIYQNKFRKAYTAAGIRRWKHNALRHSYASYFLAFHQDAGRAALELGHSESRTLFAHYRELVAPEDAKAYWLIFPPAGGGNVVPFAA
jgi:integrase